MSSKKVFNVKDKVFAKIRGYPAWPAMVSGVKGDTPSKTKYNVYFYGTGERAECKPEDLCSYEENKVKLGKPNKRRYFTEALLQIEDDKGDFINPEDDNQVLSAQSNTSTIEQESPAAEVENSGENERINEPTSENEGKLTIDESNLSNAKKNSTSRKSLGISISKGTKRKISDVKPEAPLKKSMTNKSKSSDIEKKGRPVIVLQKLVIEKIPIEQQVSMIKLIFNS